MTSDNDNDRGHDRQTEFGYEQEHLEGVVGSMDAAIRHHASRGPMTAGDTKAANIVKSLMDTDLESLKGARNRPYFGRIDYSTGGGEVRSIYIGDIHVANRDPNFFVASRNAPVARLYYRPTDGFFEVPDRAGGYTKRETLVELKRILQIEDARLLDFEDVLRLPPGRDMPQSTSSATLDEKLSNASDEHFSDAVETIQPEQYEQIAATQKPVLIVQGAAGSGKSLIGLHRIDFMLSPYSNIGNLNRPTADRVIMFGPSRAFLEYVSGLLPGLGVRNIRQTTVSGWLLSQLSSRTTLSRGDSTFMDLMNNRRRLTSAEIQAHAFKGGLQMKRLSDNYVNGLRRNIRLRAGHAGGLQVAGNPPMSLSAARLRQEVSDALKSHEEPNAAKAYLANRLAQQLGARPSAP